MSETSERDIEKAREWLDFAVQDLDLAFDVHRRDAALPRHLCGMAQQAIEKAIKAGLVLDGEMVPNSHDLNALINQLGEEWGMRQRFPNLDRISGWATRIRYPGARNAPSEQDAESALRVAKSFLDAFKNEFDARVVALRSDDDPTDEMPTP